MLYSKLIEAHTDERHIALTLGEKNYTYRELDEYSKRILYALHELGICCGDRVLIGSDNDLETVLLILACIAGGIVIIPINDKVGLEQYCYVVENCMPKCIFAKSTNLDHWYQGRTLVLDKAACVAEWVRSDMGNNENNLSVRYYIDSSYIGYILYTSGSEGHPRGVVARYRQIIFCIDAINKTLEHVRSDRILSSLPLSFDYGLYQIFLTFSAGANLFLVPGHLFQKIPGLLEKYKITGWPGIPFLFKLLLKTKMLERIKAPELRYITSTGELFHDSLIKHLEQLFPKTYIIPMYGLTECKRVSIMPMDFGILSQKRGSCGIPLPGTQVYLRDVQEETGIGELVVCGPNVMDGYWNAEEETKQYFSLNKKGSNTLYSGDLFIIDDDGFLFFHGRKKRILKVRGYRIGCVEIEKLVEAMEDVIECAVFDQRMDVGDERICVCVVSSCCNIEESVRKQLTTYFPVLQEADIRVYRQPLARNENGKIDIEYLKREYDRYDY